MLQFGGFFLLGDTYCLPSVILSLELLFFGRIKAGAYEKHFYILCFDSGLGILFLGERIP